MAKFEKLTIKIAYIGIWSFFGIFFLKVWGYFGGFLGNKSPTDMSLNDILIWSISQNTCVFLPLGSVSSSSSFSRSSDTEISSKIKKKTSN